MSHRLANGITEFLERHGMNPGWFWALFSLGVLVVLFTSPRYRNDIKNWDELVPILKLNYASVLIAAVIGLVLGVLVLVGILKD